MDDVFGLYIHIPFCRSKCYYCDFNSFANFEALFADYAAALIQEMDQAGPAKVETIYIGGGTPTVLPLVYLEQILAGTRTAFDVDAEAEISIEANPGTVDASLLAGLRRLGFNRLSLGMQSFDDGELRLLGRIHTAAEGIEAFHAIRRAGFDNVGLDLIYGLPDQSQASWRASLERALTLGPEHLSLYALSVEEGTPLAERIAQGKVPAPDPDLAAEMYELSQETLVAAGYIHYEISNWARRSVFRCRHNLIYWRNQFYLGIGAGAHSWAGGRRWANASPPAEYTARVLRGESPIAAEERIPPDLEISETMIMGLRLVDEGVGFERFRERFGMDVRDRFAPELSTLEAAGLVEVNDQRIRLSPRGRLLGNQVFLQFLPG